MIVDDQWTSGGRAQSAAAALKLAGSGPRDSSKSRSLWVTGGRAYWRGLDARARGAGRVRLVTASDSEGGGVRGPGGDTRVRRGGCA
jgi:hypothetical protein